MAKKYKVIGVPFAHQFDIISLWKLVVLFVGKRAELRRNSHG